MSKCLSSSCRIKPVLLSIAFGILLGFLAIVLIVTLFIEKPPVNIGNERVIAYNRGESLNILYTRDIFSFENFFATRVLRIICGGVAYSLNDSIHYFVDGEKSYDVKTIYIAEGFHQKVGTECSLKRVLVCHPLFSLVDKAYPLEVLNFKVQKDGR